MTKLSKVLFIIWIVLALASFVGAFFTPVLLIKVIGIVFGSMNSLIVLSWAIASIQAMMENKKLNAGK